MLRTIQLNGTAGWYYAIMLVAVLAGAVSRQLNLLMLVGCMLSGPMLFSLLYGRLMLRRLTVERKLPPDLRADQRLIVDINVANPRRWMGAWSLEVDDSLERAPEGASARQRVPVSVFFPHVAAGEARHVSYEGSLPRRGRYYFGPLRITTRFPLGLVRHSRMLEQPGELVVHPRLGQLTHDWAGVLREDAAGRQPRQRRGLLEADFYGLRDWRAGDSRRWIHWRTSARRGSLVVRQFEQHRGEDLAILVDLWQPAEPGSADVEHVETAVSFVATVIAQACRQPAHNLILGLSAREPLHRGGAASPAFFREQMDSLALAVPHCEDILPSSLTRALAEVPPSMSTLIVSTRPVDWIALRAATRGGRAARRHVQVLNVASDELKRYFRG